MFSIHSRVHMPKMQASKLHAASQNSLASSTQATEHRTHGTAAVAVSNRRDLPSTRVSDTVPEAGNDLIYSFRGATKTKRFRSALESMLDSRARGNSNGPQATVVTTQSSMPLVAESVAGTLVWVTLYRSIGSVCAGVLGGVGGLAPCRRAYD